MCGITGFFQSPQQQNDGSQKLDRLLHPILRRGPDENGKWLSDDASIGLAQSRLSIIDLSPTGRQPMISQCGNYIISFNGEIYNFQEIKISVKPKGSSDTEILLEAIAEFGVEKTLEKIEGMFAFALWDKRKKTLTLARDRIGEKPLYYGISGKGFLFSSEPSSLAADPYFSRKFSATAITEYLRTGVIPREHCIYENARKLLPGHFLVLGSAPLSLSELKPTPYWQPSFSPGQASLENLDALLSKSVKQVLISDAPLGVFLSGGIDSSLVAQYAAENSREKLKTFTIGFAEKSHDESSYSKMVAERLGSEHRIFQFTEKSAWEMAIQMADIYSEPFSDSSQIATALLAKEAKRTIKVALSGDGGDEVFFGYNRYRFVPKVLELKSLLKPISKIPFADLAMGAMPFPHMKDKWRKIRDLLSAKDGVEAYLKITSLESAPKNLMLNCQPDVQWPKKLRELEKKSLPAFLRHADLLDYISSDVLAKVDRASMAFGLETRAPLLHPALLNFAFKISPEEHMKNGELKYLLKQLLRKKMPLPIWDRPKTGFSVPIMQWLRGPLRDWAETLLSENELAKHGILHPVEARKIWQNSLAGKKEQPHLLWAIVQLQAWLAKR